MEAIKKKITPLSKLRNKPIDTVAHRHSQSGFKNNARLVGKGYTCWHNMYQIRVAADRAQRFVYDDDQWGDMTMFNGEWMTERQAIALQGKTPLTYNMMRPIIVGAHGTFLRASTEPFAVARNPEKREVAEMVTMALQCNWQQSAGNMRVLTSNMFETYESSGFAIARESWEDLGDGNYDATTYTYPLNMVFFDSNMRDPNMRDLTMIGVIHDVTPGELRSKFRLPSSKWEELEREFPKIYDDLDVESLDLLDRNKLEYQDFFFSADKSRCRIYEIWTKEVKCRFICVDPMRGQMFKVEDENIDKVPLEIYGKTIMQENAERKQMALEAGITDENEIPYIDYGQLPNSLKGTGEKYDEYWYYQYLTANGTIIEEGESPYSCGLPFTLLLFPFINGNVHSFATDLIPIQKGLNRDEVLSDWSIRSAAKGAIIVDKHGLGDETPEDVRENWSRPDGVVFWDSKKGGQPPKQAASSSTNIGIDGAMNRKLKYFEEISGVHGAIQGKDALSGQSAALYAQQTENGTTMLLPMLDRFKNFMRDIAVKKAKIICQFAPDNRFINIDSNYYSTSANRFDRSRLNDFEYDISIGERQFTEVARQMSNQLLLELFKAKAIGARTLIAAGEFPFGDKLSKYLDEEEARMQQQADMGQPITQRSGNPQLMQQIMNEAGAGQMNGGINAGMPTA